MAWVEEEEEEEEASRPTQWEFSFIHFHFQRNKVLKGGCRKCKSFSNYCM